MQGTPVLELEDLEVALAGRPILKGLAGSVSGRVIGVLGPNGAGKTTLLSTILGFHRPRRGTLRVLGWDVRTDLDQIRAAIGYMPENEAYIANLSAVSFVQLMAELSGLPREAALERAHEALFYVGLGEARYRKLDTYSLGMKQLAKLAQAIAHGPKVLLLDEPTNGLDPSARQRMIELIRDIAASGVHVLLSSHLLRDVEAVSDEVIVLRDGQVATIADLASERSSNRRFLEIEAIAGGVGGDGGAEASLDGFVAAIGGRGCTTAELPNRRLKVILPEAFEVRDLYQEAHRHGLTLRRLTTHRDSLEHLFLKAMDDAPKSTGAAPRASSSPETPHARP
jgi:ABC-2 type transport system ATP-binding protein